MDHMDIKVSTIYKLYTNIQSLVARHPFASATYFIDLITLKYGSHILCILYFYWQTNIDWTFSCVYVILVKTQLNGSEIQIFQEVPTFLFDYTELKVKQYKKLLMNIMKE